MVRQLSQKTLIRIAKCPNKNLNWIPQARARMCTAILRHSVPYLVFRTLFPVQNAMKYFTAPFLVYMKQNVCFLLAGEFWRSIRIPESSAVILLDMCVFPHCDHVHGGLWWCLLPDCPWSYVPCIFPPCWVGKFIQLQILF